MIDPIQKNLERCFAVIDADPNTDWADIEKKYRKLVHQWHPDRNSDKNSEFAKSKFIEINSAYKTLKLHYRSKKAPARHIPKGQKGRQHGAMKVSVEKPSRSKWKVTAVVTASIVLLILFGIVLWSIESQEVQKNRDRAITSSLSHESAASRPLHKDTIDSTHTNMDLEP